MDLSISRNNLCLPLSSKHTKYILNYTYLKVFLMGRGPQPRAPYPIGRLGRARYAVPGMKRVT